MAKFNPVKVDAWGHVLPPKYREAIYKFLPADSYWHHTKNIPGFDLKNLLSTMDEFNGQVMVLTLNVPPVETIANPKQAAEFAKSANDEMAELVARYPDKFVAAIASLPMNNMDAALKEVDRTIKDLKFRGVQIYTPINDKPLDSAEFLPLYEKMNQYDLPIYLHPYRYQDRPDYRTEKESKYLVYHIFGWPYETSAAMTRLVFSGVMAKYPNLKIIAHHTGAMVPFLESRIIGESARKLMHQPVYAELTQAPIEYYKRFYCDTEIRTPPALMCAYHFFGAEHVLFGTGMPYGRSASYSIHQTIDAIDRMGISDREKQMIFKENIIKLLRLPA